jgi:hypothetical protein
MTKKGTQTRNKSKNKKKKLFEQTSKHMPDSGMILRSSRRKMNNWQRDPADLQLDVRLWPYYSTVISIVQNLAITLSRADRTGVLVEAIGRVRYQIRIASSLSQVLYDRCRNRIGGLVFSAE